MLDIDTVSIRNFLSYGDEKTVVKLSDLGPCLVTGEVVAGPEYQADSHKLSNGAGKSTIIESILWCLFGKTSRIAAPGDKIIHDFTGKNCQVSVTFKNGDKITRSRKMKGHNDLLLVKDGEDVSLGTTKMQQAALNKELGLDWDNFCGSVFFSQFAKPWMEMSDQRRKDAMEREFHLDRIKLYADSAKAKLKKAEAQQESLQDKIDNLDSTIAGFKAQIERLQEASSNFDLSQQARIDEAVSTKSSYQKNCESITKIDIKPLKAKWDAIKAVEEKIDSMEEGISELRSKKNRIISEIRHKQSIVDKWEGMGDICSKCEQPITEDHKHSKYGSIADDIKALKKENADLTKEIDKKQKSVDFAILQLNKKKPDMSIREAERINNDAERSLSRWQKAIENQDEVIAKIKAEKNHYDDSIVETEESIKGYEAKKVGFKDAIGKFDKLIPHLKYIHRAYHDRRKIKSYMLAEYIPYLNSRINHYLDRMGLDLRLEFTNALGIKSGLWGYETFSGGECKRVDVAIMLSMFDLHTVMYGRQCNLLVFDEVDGRLDIDGAERLADIIRTEFSSKVDTILVISQRIDMRGAFSSEIKVRREDRVSRIVDIIQ